MVRHEYVDHVAALVAASLAPSYPPRLGGLDWTRIARDALAVAEALADLRYPEADAGAPRLENGKCVCNACLVAAGGLP